MYFMRFCLYRLGDLATSTGDLSYIQEISRESGRVDIDEISAHVCLSVRLQTKESIKLYLSLKKYLHVCRNFRVDIKKHLF